MFLESGGDNLAASFSPELVDASIYVIDVSGGDKIPRKGGPGVTRSDLLVINKIDLAPQVGASLEVMARDARRAARRPAVRLHESEDRRGTGRGRRLDSARTVVRQAEVDLVGQLSPIGARGRAGESSGPTDGASRRLARRGSNWCSAHPAAEPSCSRLRRASVPAVATVRTTRRAAHDSHLVGSGRLRGRSLRQTIRLERGARVRLTSQSAVQVHPDRWRPNRVACVDDSTSPTARG